MLLQAEAISKQKAINSASKPHRHGTHVHAKHMHATPNICADTHTHARGRDAHTHANAEQGHTYARQGKRRAYARHTWEEPAAADLATDSLFLSTFSAFLSTFSAFTTLGVGAAAVTIFMRGSRTDLAEEWKVLISLARDCFDSPD